MNSIPKGYTIIELLITLLILGVLATFTIPKISQDLISSQSPKYSYMARNTAFMIVTAYQHYTMSAGAVPSTFSTTNLTPYLNYVSLDTTSVIDATPQLTSRACSAVTPCLLLHNGGRLYLSNYQFGGVGTSNTIQFLFDPDGIYTTSSTAQNAPGKSLQLQLYYNGFIMTRGTARNPSCHSGVCGWTPDPTYDPTWFTGF